MMKKVFSLILAICLVAGIMMFNVSAADDISFRAEYTPVEGGATVDLIISGTGSVNAITVYLSYDKTKATFDSYECVAPYAASWTPKTAANTTMAVTIGGNKGKSSTYIKISDITTADADYLTVNGDVKLYTFKFTGAALTASDFTFPNEVFSSKSGATAASVNIGSGATTLINTKTGVNAEKVSVVDKTPVEEDKTTTFEKVYKADDGKSAAVFGKAPAGTTEAGLYIEKDGAALEHKTAMSKTDKGAGYFPAYTSELTKAFGVIIRDLAPGSYTAKIYADNTFGDAQLFVIE